jgi:hypothetical protein
MPKLRHMTTTLALTALAVLAAAAPAGASKTQESIFQDDRMLLFSGGSVRDRALNEMDSLGADTIHTLAFWRSIAPAAGETTKPAGFDGSDPASYPAGQWDAYDDLVRSADARGLQVLLTPSGRIPFWASSSSCGRGPDARQNCKPDIGEWEAFVTALGKRYSGSYRDENQGGGILPRISRWSFWNEANLGSWLRPQYIRRRGRTVAYSPQLYRKLVVAGTKALKATGHGTDQILLGETAPIGRTTGGLSTRPIAPLTFLRQVLCLTSSGRADRSGDCRNFRRLAVTGVSHHPYNRGGGGTARSSGKSNEVTVATSSRLSTLLSQAARARRITRSAASQIYFTEYGFQTKPPERFFGVSLTRQADYINEADYLAYRNSRVRAVAQYELEDEPDANVFNTGLRFTDGREKPSLAAYRLPIFADRRGSKVRIWGQVRPADGATTVEIQAGKGNAFEALTNVAVNSPRGYFETSVPLQRGKRYRVKWSNGGQDYFSRKAAAR